jgi:hypothetical protein
VHGGRTTPVRPAASRAQRRPDFVQSGILFDRLHDPGPLGRRRQACRRICSRHSRRVRTTARSGDAEPALRTPMELAKNNRRPVSLTPAMFCRVSAEMQNAPAAGATMRQRGAVGSPHRGGLSTAGDQAWDVSPGGVPSVDHPVEQRAGPGLASFIAGPPAINFTGHQSPIAVEVSRSGQRSPLAALGREVPSLELRRTSDLGDRFFVCCETVVKQGHSRELQAPFRGTTDPEMPQIWPDYPPSPTH